jgi:hypothetical protein
MLKVFNGLTQQLFEKDFRDMLFSIYNFAEEEYYISRLKGLGYDYDIDSLEFMFLDSSNITDDNILESFKRYIETDLQKENVIIGILLYKGKNGIVPVAIKPKNVNLSDILREV